MTSKSNLFWHCAEYPALALPGSLSMLIHLSISTPNFKDTKELNSSQASSWIWSVGSQQLTKRRKSKDRVRKSELPWAPVRLSASKDLSPKITTAVSLTFMKGLFPSHMSIIFYSFRHSKGHVFTALPYSALTCVVLYPLAHLVIISFVSETSSTYHNFSVPSISSHDLDWYKCQSFTPLPLLGNPGKYQSSGRI